LVDSIGQVYKNGVLAARLERKASSIVFEYYGNYLQSSGPAVATTLPLSLESIVLANGATPAFFAGLLPEGRRLGAIAERAKLSLDDDLSLLLAVGADLIGDVQVVPEGIDPLVEREVLLLPRETSSVSFDELRDQYFGSVASGIPGVQDKVSSQMLNAPSKSAGIDYIVKFNPKDVPFAVENEYFFLRLAKSVGLATADASLLTDSEGKHALRLQRFDRAGNVSNKQRFAVEDGCQVLGRYPLDKYRVDFVEMANRMIELSASSVTTSFQLYKQLVFNWLIGNGDAHAKNFSIRKNSLEEWQAAPAYDLLCTAFYDDRTMALPIEGQDSGWNRPLLLQVAKKLGLPKASALRTIERQLAALANLPEQIIEGVLPFPRHQNIEVSTLLKKRWKQLSAQR
jgi:serine/threonine-protein kinase HipA